MAELATIALADIDPTPDNRELDAGRVRALARSIAAIGLASPLEVYATTGGRYRLSGGHHRRAALELVGETVAPCYVAPAPADHASGVARRAASNVARVETTATDDLRHLEELARAGWTVADMAQACGRSEDWCRRRLALGELLPSVRYVADAYGPRYAEALAGVPADLGRELARLLGERNPPLARWRAMVERARARRHERDAQGMFCAGAYELVAEVWSSTDKAYVTDSPPERPYTPVYAPQDRPAPLGCTEVAERLGVAPATVVAWRRRPATRFPAPDMVASGVPLWWPETIDAWAAVPRRPGRPTRQ